MSLARPFTRDSANAKVKKAQEIPRRSPQHTPQTASGAIVQPSSQGPHLSSSFLTQKWVRERRYRLMEELFAFTDDKIAVQLWYEYQDAHDGVKWKRCYGLEDWTFASDDKMRKRQMSGNDIEISEADRWFNDGADVDEVEISEAHW